MSQQVGAGDYIITYEFEGEPHSVYFYAKSYPDADRRLKAMLQTGHITGRVEAVLHTDGKLGDKIFPLTSRKKPNGNP